MIDTRYLQSFDGSYSLSSPVSLMATLSNLSRVEEKEVVSSGYSGHISGWERVNSPYIRSSFREL